VFSCHLLRSVLSFGELMSRGEKARRIFRQLERLVSPLRRSALYLTGAEVKKLNL
jgi:hypothetical protein